jgi:soluble lytic murein transglycosylase
LAFTGHEVVRAAAWLVAWGDTERARGFLQRMDELAPIPAERALTAAFALQLGMPDSAVAVARRMGRDGLVLSRLGWPAPFNPPAPPDPGFSLGIMRQESSFDIGAVSSSGARGLMQLMPPTATLVARQLGVPVSIPGLTFDATQNMRLGTAYLQQVLNSFDGCLPLAAAGYNAGPHRVAQWLIDNGDPRVGPIDMVDWIELIPVNETRNYVQRVIENVVIYRAQRGDASPILNIPWTR